MRISLLIILTSLLFISISCLNEEQNSSRQDVFQLSGFMDSINENNIVLNDVRQINESQGLRDTIVYDQFALDSIISMILVFDFNRRERGGEFEIIKSKSEDVVCIEYKPLTSSDIIGMTVCKKGEQVISLSGSKKNNSLLGSLSQAYHFVPDESFELQSTYIDKVSKDTLATMSNLLLKNIK